MSDKDPRKRVLIVDDMPGNIRILMEALRDDYAIQVATDGEKAVRAATSDPVPDIILLDVMMPRMDGHEACRRIKANDRTKHVPVIFITARGDDDEAIGLGLGAVDYISKPFNPALVKARVRNHLELKRHQDDLEKLVRERTREIVVRLALAAEARDNDTGSHIQRIRASTALLAKKLGMAATIARTHHERWDGNGYPAGLEGEEIPLVGRIVGLVDFFDALTSKRPDKDAWPLDGALEVLREEGGRHFDPALVEVLLESADEFAAIRVRYDDDALSAPVKAEKRGTVVS